MADQFTNIQTAYENSRREYPGQNQGQTPGDRHGQPYNANQNGYPNPQGNHGGVSKPPSGYGQVSASSGNRQHGYSGSSSYGHNPQQGASSGHDVYNNQAYAKSRDMPPGTSPSSSAKSNNTYSKAQYSNPATYKASSSTTPGHDRGHKNASQRHEGGQATPNYSHTRSPGGYNERGKETTRQKGAAPPPPKNQGGHQGQPLGGQHQQRSDDGQGRHTSGREYGKSVSQEPAKMGGALYSNQNLRDRNPVATKNGHDTASAKVREIQKPPYTDSHSGNKYGYRDDANKGYDSKQSTQRGYDNKAFVQNEQGDARNKQPQRPAHHQSAGNINYANTGHYANIATPSGTGSRKGYPELQAGSHGNRYQTSSSQYDIPRQVASSSQGTMSVRSKDPNVQMDHHGNRYQNSSSQYDIPRQVEKSSQDVRPKDPRYNQDQHQQPQAPPRRPKAASAMDISQGYNASSQNIAGYARDKPSAQAQQPIQASVGKDQYGQNTIKQTGSGHNAPQSMGHSQTSLNYSAAQQPHQKAVTAGQGTMPRPDSSTTRDRVVSDSSNTNKSRYEKKSGRVNTARQGPSGPSAKRRDRMSSSSSTAQQGYHGTAKAQPNQFFDPTPPDRAASMIILPQAGSSSGVSVNPGGVASSQQAPLARATSLPSISQQVSQMQHNASMGNLNNGNLYRSKSLLSVALQGVEANQARQSQTNLRHSASLASLVASNPNLARTASTYALYELQVEKGMVPRDHQQTFVLSIVSMIILPLIGWVWGAVSLYYTVKNEVTWRTDLYQAIQVNTRLFWANVAFIGFSVLLWIIVIAVIATNV